MNIIVRLCFNVVEIYSSDHKHRPHTHTHSSHWRSYGNTLWRMYIMLIGEALWIIEMHLDISVHVWMQLKLIKRIRKKCFEFFSQPQKASINLSGCIRGKTSTAFRNGIFNFIYSGLFYILPFLPPLRECSSTCACCDDEMRQF